MSRLPNEHARSVLTINDLVNPGKYNNFPLWVKVLDFIVLHETSQNAVYEYLLGDGITVCVLKCYFNIKKLQIGHLYSIRGFRVTLAKHTIWKTEHTIIDNIASISPDNIPHWQQIEKQETTGQNWQKLYPPLEEDFTLAVGQRQSFVGRIIKVHEFNNNCQSYNKNYPLVKLSLDQGGIYENDPIQINLSIWKDLSKHGLTTFQVGDVLLLRNVVVNEFNNQWNLSVNNPFQILKMQENQAVKTIVKLKHLMNQEYKSVIVTISEIIPENYHPAMRPAVQGLKKDGYLQVYMTMSDYSGLSKTAFAHCLALWNILHNNQADQVTSPTDDSSNVSNITPDSILQAYQQQTNYHVSHIKVKVKFCGDKINTIELDM